MLFENLPINILIKNLIDIKGSNITFDELKNELNNKGDFNNNLLFKENDDLCLLYYNNIIINNQNNFFTDLENSCKSLIINKNNLQILATQYNKIIYNNDAIAFLQNKNWNNVVVYKCFEGTLILVFYHNDKWYVTTRRCLDAKDSGWIKKNSYYDLFIDAMSNKFSFDDLNKDYCYHFILVHHKNKNIVSYCDLGKEYKELYHILTTVKYTLDEIDYTINDNVKYVQQEKFNNIQELLNDLSIKNQQDIKYQTITTEGYILRYYSGELFKSPFVILKIQTEIYDTLIKLKPNNSNIHQCFLELYQKNKLNDFLLYFTKYRNDIIKRIHLSMKNMAAELLDLYHLTRKKNNSDLYNNLTYQYKKTLYEIHGLYINSRKNDFNNENNINNIETSKSINVFNIYHYLKNIKPFDLRLLYKERMILINDPINKFINKNCIATMTQSTLMNK